MPKAYTSDLRWRILWLYYYKQLKCRTIADLLYVDKSTVSRVISRYDMSGDVAPIINYRHGPVRVLEHPDLCDAMLEAVVSNPGIYLCKIRRYIYRLTGVNVSVPTICRALKQFGFTRKKLKHISIKQCSLARQEFMEEMSYIDANMIVWLDETGSDRRNGRRNYGYHLLGMTPRSYCFTVRGKHHSTITIISSRGIEDFDIYDKAINGDVFSDFVERCLVPILQSFDGRNAGSVVVMDNASIHYAEEAITSIINTGAIIRFLPPYSPNYNPLEESFAKVKSYLRANDAAYDSTTEPHLLIAMAFNTNTVTDCVEYIRHAGYQL